MTDDRDEIRQRIDIVDLVGQRVALKRAGKNWKGLCPFHDDRNPSFIVSPDMGRYKCWSCGAQGDIFNWTMETQRVDFGEAMRILAAQAGITLQRKGTVAPSRREGQERAMLDALAFFRAALANHSDAMAYAESRGLGGEVGDAWEIGYAPDVGDVLASHLKKKGHSLADCKDLFLVDTDPSGGYFDKFRGRLIFPIRDERGQLVAFGGRILGAGQPKYINSSDTPLYSKSRVLYGMNRAKGEIASQRTAILVEGYLDVIACHQAGLTNTVASLGTSLADDHVRLLKRWCESVVILYDSDAAGQKAAERASELITAAGLTAKIALLEEGNDPDTLLHSEGPVAVRKIVDHTVAPIEFRLKKLRERLRTDEEEFWREAVQILAHAPNALELERYLLPLAAEYPGLGDPAAARAALLRMVTQARRTNRKSESETSSAVDQPALATKLPGPEAAILRGVLDEKSRGLVWPVVQQTQLFQSPVGAAIAQALVTAFGDQIPEGTPGQWLHRLEDESLQERFVEIGLVDGPPITAELLIDIVDRMTKGHEKRAVVNLKPDAVGDDEKLRQLEERLRKLKA